MTAPFVDLRSDTVTRPTDAMRQAMAFADVGDDVYGEDPTVQRLEAAAAERLGKEAALFVPSGTMANQIAIRCHTHPGDAALCHETAHPYLYEAGAAALISGVTLLPVTGDRGMFTPDRIDAWNRGPDVHVAPMTLVMVEDTANRGGGAAWPTNQLAAVSKAAKAAGAATHMDGARLFNAVVASGVPAAQRTRGFDTVSICLSKGLGAPVGSLLVGSAPLIHHARRIRKALGGGMRQAGVIAAAGLHALEHHVLRLADDHARAQALAEGLRPLGVEVGPVETNMVYAKVGDARRVVTRLAELGVRCNAVSADSIRLVTHLDVDDRGVFHAIDGFSRALGR
ncbi:MAG: aminotransferase class I/II-fold pyridoxal phosphate-dependent enzyme [Alphaproteobacteria bacterium]|nr:aminotransferase class I/II-fold pyridoxal phosphate-dependent enzyme [Alphaproteobacteria bacterium]